MECFFTSTGLASLAAVPALIKDLPENQSLLVEPAIPEQKRGTNLIERQVGGPGRNDGAISPKVSFPADSSRSIVSSASRRKVSRRGVSTT